MSAWRPAATSAEVGALQPVGGVVGGAPDREHRVHAVGDEPAQQVVDAAVLEQREREQVVGGGDEVRRRDRQRCSTSATMPGRIASIMPRSSTVSPARSFSRQSGSVKISWSDVMPAAR